MAKSKEEKLEKKARKAAEKAEKAKQKAEEKAAKLQAKRDAAAAAGKPFKEPKPPSEFSLLSRRLADYDPSTPISEIDPALFEPLARLNEIVREAVTKLTRAEVRSIVRLYYQVQKVRIGIGQASKSPREEDEDRDDVPTNPLLAWISHSLKVMETDIAKAMKLFVEEYNVGNWMLSICGVGPIIAAGLLSFLDVRRASVAGAFWRLAGIEPTLVWLGKEGSAKALIECGFSGKQDPTEEQFTALSKLCGRQPASLQAKWAELPTKARLEEFRKYLSRRPWNATLKTLAAYKLGESFVKQRNRDSDIYGKVYWARKGYEIRRNMSGEMAEVAKQQLPKYTKDKPSYPWYAGCLPAAVWDGYTDLNLEQQAARVASMRGEPGSGVHMLAPHQIHARARRYAAKLFIAHLHHVMFQDYYGPDVPVPKPYILEKSPSVHTHFIAPPNLPIPSGGRKLTEFLVD